MEIERAQIKICDLIKGYEDNGVEGVTALNGKLDVRPPYQREFVYTGKNIKKRDLVIDTVLRGFPLNTMYWAVCDDSNGSKSYEILDGQQRTISICQYAAESAQDFSIEDDRDGNKERRRYFFNLTEKDRKKFLNYELDVYKCRGDTDDVLNWFERINVNGEPLNNQEIANAFYHGPWLTDAKRYFSKPNGGAHVIGKHYMNCTENRQDYLRMALRWIIGSNSESDIQEYMSAHHQNSNADELKKHFKAVIDWIEIMFPEYHSTMKSIGPKWGNLHRRFKDKANDSAQIDEVHARVKMIFELGDTIIPSKLSGVWEYALTGDTNHLEARAFSKDAKQLQYDRQNGICRGVNQDGSPAGCGEYFENVKDMHADHIVPWWQGGKTEIENCQVLCGPCNKRKGGR